MVDGTHVPIQPPKEVQVSYYNRKRFHSMNNQVVVAIDRTFVDVSIGYSGSTHDARMFRMSRLATLMAQQRILDGPVREVNGVQIP